MMHMSYAMHNYTIPTFLNCPSLPYTGQSQSPLTSSRCTRRIIRCVRAPSTQATTDSSFNLQNFATVLSKAQSKLCQQIERIDEKALFCKDSWESETGNGCTRVLQNGNVFEKAGVNVSVVHGILSETRAAAMQSRGRPCAPGSQYHAAALSFVLHAQSPFMPTLRGDVRIFMNGDSYWGGGGVDLTIFYVNKPEIVQFHRHWKQICDEFDTSLYPQFKKQCDDYFYIPSRREHRGVGGLFYDELSLDGAELVKFQSRMLEEFLLSYVPIINANKKKSWNEEQKKWQRIRRGRYLEFNLLTDRGVRFGLDRADDSRTEAIMISAPPSIEWPYNFRPEANSPEEQTVQLLRGPPINWVEESGDSP